MLRKIILLPLIMGAAALVPTLSAAEAPAEIFNGKDLDGWEQRGGKADYSVEGGVIVGKAVVNTDNSFLCTRKVYGDFILDLDFKDDPDLNSGVQFRSECFDHETVAPVKDEHGKEIKIPANLVHGYQYEIDLEPKRGRWWTGGIYEEARRGWLYPGTGGGSGAEFTARGKEVSKPNDWNHLRIEASGTSIKTFLNGEARGSITDGVTPSGFIGLQVHSIGSDAAKAGLKVQFKNIRLQDQSMLREVPFVTHVPGRDNVLTDAEKAAGWRLLWDGKTYDGWRKASADQPPGKGWEIKDGVISVLGSNGAEAANGGDIVTREKFADFELVADFKITPGANSGIKYYVDTDLNKGPGSAIGLEYQILDDERHPDAKLGRDGDRTMASLYDLMPAAASKKPNPIGEWNTARIISRGHHVEHWLNGEKVLEYERSSKEFRDLVAISKYAKWGGFGELPEGPILLQDHGDAVSFRSIKIRVPAGK